jgi:hypothetical protein
MVWSISSPEFAGKKADSIEIAQLTTGYILEGIYANET